MSDDKKETYVVFDTETTGLPGAGSNKRYNLKAWPRMVELAWIVCDNDTHDIIKMKQSLIRPDNYIIPESVVTIHGITTEEALAYGLLLKEVLAHFLQDCKNACRLVAHNITFDVGVIACEAKRCKLDGDIMYDHKELYCTKKHSKGVALYRAYANATNEVMATRHRALADTMACHAVYKWSLTTVRSPLSDHQIDFG